MRVINKHTAPLGLPGAVVALGGTELQPGATEVDDAAWAIAKQNSTIKTWLGCGLLVELAAELAPGSDSEPAADPLDEAPKKRGR